MSVIVKGMDMPSSCRVCRFSYFVVGKEMNCGISFSRVTAPYGFRNSDCPLVEIPTPHGRLIDANEVKGKMLKYGFKAPDMTVTEFVEDVLIKAEVSEE